VLLKILRIFYMSTQNLVHNIGFSVVLGRMLAPKDLCAVSVVGAIPCMVSLKCKIIFIITSTYIISISYRNIEFLAGIVSLEVVNAMATVALNVRCATSRNSGR
jgi:hypothetical protein